MKTNSNLLLSIVIMFSLLNIADIITAMFILPGESNPIYILTNSIYAVWALKFLIVGGVFYVYSTNEYPSRFSLFSFCYLLILGSVMIAFGVYSNIIGIINPVVVQNASELSSSAKLTYYTQVVGFFMIIPYLISMIAFKAYDIIERKITYKKTNIKK